jgi:Carbohydrate esterase, sialic acid-specific acetylesterase
MVNINGTMVPKEKVVAFIHIGHSNMAGRADVPLPLRPYFFTIADPHGWIFSANGQFTPALEPNTAGDGTNNMGAPGQVTPLGGPGTALIKQAIVMAPDYYFLSLGFGQSSAYCSQFLPGNLYYDSLIAAAKAAKGKVTFGAIVIMLGITERHGTAADITGYPQCINQLVTQIRTDVGVPDLPLLLTDYEMTATGMLAPTQPFAQSIIPQIHMVPTVVSNSALVPTDGLVLIDDHHFNLQSHQIWTQRALDIMKTKGWFPWQ